MPFSEVIGLSKTFKTYIVCILGMSLEQSYKPRNAENAPKFVKKLEIAKSIIVDNIE